MNQRVLKNRSRYNRMAGFYEWLVRSGSLGQFQRFHQAVADAIEADPGALLLDLGCGPGTLTPRLLPKVGPEGAILGVDSDAMIERARALSGQRGWHNVRFARADAREFAPDRSPGIIVFCLSLTTLPDPARCFARAVSWLAPGGQLVVLDSFLEPKRRLAGLVIRLESPLVGAGPTDVSLTELAAPLEAVRLRRFHGGVYALLSGRKPRARATQEIPT